MGRIRSAFELLMVAGLVVAGCSRLSVRSVHGPAANFRDLRTHAWLPAEEAAPADQRVSIGWAIVRFHGRVEQTGERIAALRDRFQ